METVRNQALPGQYLTFRLGAQPYGVPISSVREINRVGAITPVPAAPVFVAGVTNLRGKVIPVVDLKVKLGFERSPFTKETCVIVIDGANGQVGAIVDAVTGVVELTGEQLEPAPDLGDADATAFVLGLGKMDEAVVILVDAVGALARENLGRTLGLAQMEVS